MSLYRKYRPQKFTDIIGQAHIRQTLSNALANNSIGHAYLFSGPKGSGKTTTARLLAKAINCQGRALNKKAIEPCNDCVSCKEITFGQSMDMVEIDAASNRGIDEMRELREKIKFAPAAASFKVYIIDECHMLTKEAFNALLKTLEEPPSHAVFILATTELHKVPATILSRTQVFDFKKAQMSEMMELLTKVSKAEKIEVEEDALKLVARLSFGAFRDGLSMFDQISGLGKNGQKITLALAQEILGQSTEESVWEFIETLAKKDRTQALKIVNNVYFEGKDLENFIQKTTEILRQVVFLKAGISEYSESDLRINQVAKLLTIKELTTLMEALVQAMPKVKSSTLGQLPLEMAIFEWTKESNDNNESGRLETILENKASDSPQKEIIVSKVIEPQKSEVLEMKVPVAEEIKEAPIQVEPKKEEKKEKEPNNQAKTIDPEVWQKVISAVKSHNNTLAALMGGAVMTDVTDNEINLSVRFKFHAEQITNKKNIALIEERVNQVCGGQYKVNCVVDKNLEIKKPLEEEEVLLNTAKEVFDI